VVDTVPRGVKPLGKEGGDPAAESDVFAPQPKSLRRQSTFLKAGKRERETETTRRNKDTLPK